MKKIDSNIEIDEELELMLSELSDRLDKYEALQAKIKLVEKFHSRVIKMGIPLKFTQGYTIESEDQMETVIEKVKADYEAAKKLSRQ